MASATPVVLDPAQLNRIESVHRGFLYQHLYAVGCMFVAAKAAVTRLLIETDEDLQLDREKGATYVQVKLRRDALQTADVTDALERFASIRRLHAARSRPGQAAFAIVASSRPSASLQAIIDNQDWPDDVDVYAPNASTPDDTALPPPQSTVADAISWCTAQAELLPLASVRPLTLVWKLVGYAQHIAGGAANHTIDVSELPVLFEQLLAATGPDPEPVSPYRPHMAEPPLVTSEGVRLLVGPGGCGKTSWAAEAMLHGAPTMVYCDVHSDQATTLPGAVLAQTCATLYGQFARVPQEAVMPGNTPLASLAALDAVVQRSGQSITVLLDDIQRAVPSTVAELVKTAPHFRWILLGQQHPSVTQLEGLLGVSASEFSGWSEDTIAAVCSEAGCTFQYEDIAALRQLTAGAPLYVTNLVRISGTAHAGSIGALCDALKTRTHTYSTWQESALALVVDQLSPAAREIATILHLAAVPLSPAELSRLSTAAYGQSGADAAAAMRELHKWRVVERSQRGELDLHDQYRLVLSQTMTDEVRTRVHVTLKEVLLESIRTNRKDPARFVRLLEVFSDLGEWTPLVDAVTAVPEWFRELGMGTRVYVCVERAAALTRDRPSEHFWLNDTLAYIDLCHQRYAACEARLPSMREAVARGSLGARAADALALKEMLLIGGKGDFRAAHSLFQKTIGAISDQTTALVFRYNYALLAWRNGYSDDAKLLLRALVDAYFKRVRLTPKDVFLTNTADIADRLGDYVDRLDDLKHLADTFDLLGRVEGETGNGRLALLASLQALKLYDLAGAVSSTVRVAQDVAEGLLLWLDDPDEARRFLEGSVLPALQKHKLAEHVLPVKVQYAAVLSRCGHHAQAVTLITELQPYITHLEGDRQREYDAVRARILDASEQFLRRETQLKAASVSRIAEISRGQFDAYGPARSHLTALIGEERLWFAAESGAVIGVVLFDKSDKDWAYVILGRDEHGRFRAIRNGHSFASEEASQKELLIEMGQLVDSGETVFPQD